MPVHPAAFLGEVFSTVVARVDEGSDVSLLGTSWQRSILESGRAVYSAEHSALGRVEWWLVAVVSLLALFAVGGVAGRIARRLVRRSTPELTVLLNQSAAFYGRWPEDQLAGAPRGEVVVEAVRCGRIIELLEGQAVTTIDRGAAECGPVDGLQAWIALLFKRINAHDGVPTGPAAYA